MMRGGRERGTWSRMGGRQRMDRIGRGHGQRRVRVESAEEQYWGALIGDKGRVTVARRWVSTRSGTQSSD